ncbi:MAG TPA: single-stranded-DNA-specific exonuclease RecJ [Solirubrobacteraceae bacterium]|nr:single-stranded-DNA-specific exonuclease RecJ [Solirubrobacteraceae bacterium]
MLEPRFQIADCPPAAVARLRGALGVSGAVAQVLVRRGMHEPAAARAFLAAGEAHAPSAFAGMHEAVGAILAHVRRARRITVHGDYDVDGVCATAVLVRTLRGLGADVDWYLPDRRGDGYGLGAATVRRLAARGTRLLVTVDCAITAVSEVALARELGMDVIVSDHHAPREDAVLPPARIVHPGVCGYPFPQLCAAAVAHKLAQALLDEAGGPAGPGDPGLARARARLEEDLDLVALATIADVVALVGENRTLARRGLRALAGTSKPGLRALMSVAGLDPARADERAVAFALAPRLNAAGRIDRADAALELLLTEDVARAGQVASELERANRERRQVELRIRAEAEAQMAAAGERYAYVLAAEGWHPGVIGIVASRLAERSRRPVVMIALHGDAGRGSGRSGVEAFDLLAGLTACSDRLRAYGGHRAAAGLELDRAHVGEFAAALDAYAGRMLAPADLAPVERVDAIVAGEELGMGLAEELQALAPFGMGNPPVSLMVQDASFTDVRPMGEGRHARFTVQSPRARARAVAFGTGGRLPVAEGQAAQATFTLEVNEYNGVSEPRLVLRQARPARDECAERPQPVPAGLRAVAVAPSQAARQPPPPPRPEPGHGHDPEPQEELVLFALP